MDIGVDNNIDSEVSEDYMGILITWSADYVRFNFKGLKALKGKWVIQKDMLPPGVKEMFSGEVGTVNFKGRHKRL